MALKPMLTPPSGVRPTRNRSALATCCPHSYYLYHGSWICQGLGSRRRGLANPAIQQVFCQLQLLVIGGAPHVLPGGGRFLLRPGAKGGAPLGRVVLLAPRQWFHRRSPRLRLAGGSGTGP